MANRVSDRANSRPKRRTSGRQARKRVELIALTQTSRCGAPRRGRGLRGLFKTGLLLLALLLPLLLAAGTLGGTVTLDPPPDSAFWRGHAPQTGTDPQRSGHTDVALLASAPSEQWRKGGFEPFLAGPVMDRENAYVADRNGTVAALNLTTGRTVWSIKLTTTLSATPALGYGWLYVPTESKELVALSARTGTEIVRVKLDGVAKAPPLVSDGRVFQGTDAGILQVLDATTLDEVWRFDTATVGLDNDGTINKTMTDTKLRKPIRAAPAAYDGRVYVAAWNHKVYAFSTTGNIHGNPNDWYWTVTVDDVISAAPAVDRYRKHLLIGSTAGQIEARDLATGIHKWRVDAGGSFHKGLTVSSASIVAATSDGRILSIDPTAGTVSWQHVDEAGHIAAPVQTRDALVTLTANGTVRMRSLANGTGLSLDGMALSWRMPSGAHASPAVTERGIVVADQSGTVMLIGPTPVRRADIRVEAIARPINVSAGVPFQLNVTVRNLGPDDAPNTLLWAATPAGNTTPEKIPLLAAGATKSYNLVMPGLDGGTHEVTARMSTEATDPTPADAQRSTVVLVAAFEDGLDAGAGEPAGADTPSTAPWPNSFGEGFTAAWSGWMGPVAIVAIAAGASGFVWFRKRLGLPSFGGFGDTPSQQE